MGDMPSTRDVGYDVIVLGGKEIGYSNAHLPN
jgi:hypothetical protein